MFGKQKKDLKKKAEAEIEEIADDVLDQVSGAGDPFEDLPRVPSQNIDDELREKG